MSNFIASGDNINGQSVVIVEKFTPGPWGVYPDSPPENVYCDDELGSRVAKCDGEFSTLTIEEKRANAKLIAAAPEMYAMLKNMFNGLSGLTVAEGTTIKLVLSVDEVNKALAVLAKVNK